MALKIGELYGELGLDANPFEKALDRSMQSGAQKASAIGGKMTKSLTLPLVAAGGAAAKLSIDFDTSMSRIQGLVGLSAEEVDGLRGSVLDLSGETAKSPQELADALFTVTSAGFRGAEAMNVLEMAAKASAAGLGETRTIAEALTGAVNAYGPEVLDAAKATDILVATARAGNFESSELAGSLGRITPFAKQAGVSFEDVGGAIALMTRINNSANESITQGAALFKAFVVPTEEAKKILGDLGMTAGDVRDSLAENGLAGTLQMLDERLGGNREQLGKLLGSSEAQIMAFEILDADAQTLAGTFGMVADHTGMLGDAFGVTADSPGFKLQQALAEIQVAAINAGDTIVPFVTALGSGVGDLASAFANLPGPVQNVLLGFAGLLAVMGPALSIGGRLVTNIGRIIDAYKAMPKTMGAATGAIVVGTAMLYAWTKAKADAKAKADEFADAMDRDSGVMAENTRELILNRLEQNNQTDDLRRAGVSFEELTRAVEGNDEARASLIQKIKDEGEANFGLITTLATLFNNYDASIEQQKDRNEIGAENIGVTDAQAQSAEELAASLGLEADAAQEAVDVVQELTNAINDMIGVHLSAEEATLRVVEEFDRLTATLDENGATLDTNTEAGRANRSQIVSTTKSILSHVEALAEQGATTDEVNWYLQAHTANLRETMAQAGLTEAQIDSYITTLGLTPDNIATLVQVHGVAEAEAALSNLARVRVAQIQAQVTGARTAGLQLNAGGVNDPKRHEGGRVSPDMPYRVGTYGHEELFVPDSAGTVFSKSETADMARGRGRSGGGGDGDTLVADLTVKLDGKAIGRSRTVIEGMDSAKAKRSRNTGGR